MKYIVSKYKEHSRKIFKMNKSHLPRKTWRHTSVVVNRKRGNGSWSLRRMSSSMVSNHSRHPNRQRPSLCDGEVDQSVANIEKRQQDEKKKIE